MAVLQDHCPMARAAEYMAIIKSLEKAKGIDSTFVLCPQAHQGGFSITSATSSTGSGIVSASTTIAAVTTSTYNARSTSTNTTTSSSSTLLWKRGFVLRIKQSVDLHT
jgi:hypothetical protein